MKLVMDREGQEDHGAHREVQPGEELERADAVHEASPCDQDHHHAQGGAAEQEQVVAGMNTERR
jgi:hypothetical protein